MLARLLQAGVWVNPSPRCTRIFQSVCQKSSCDSEARDASALRRFFVKYFDTPLLSWVRIPPSRAMRLASGLEILMFEVELQSWVREYFEKFRLMPFGKSEEIFFASSKCDLGFAHRRIPCIRNKCQVLCSALCPLHLKLWPPFPMNGVLHD